MPSPRPRAGLAGTTPDLEGILQWPVWYGARPRCRAHRLEEALGQWDRAVMVQLFRPFRGPPE